jgi:hypothetical protein
MFNYNRQLRNRKDYSGFFFDEDNERVHHCSDVDPESDMSRDFLAKSDPDLEYVIVPVPDPDLIFSIRNSV